MNRKELGNLYNDIDFLPPTYRQAIEARWTVRRAAGLGAILLAALGGLAWQTVRTREELRTLHANVQQQLANAHKQATDFATLQQEQSDLQKQLSIHRQLKLPINYSQITGTLASLMPLEITLCTLDLKNETVTITQDAPPSSGDANPIKRERHFVSIDLQGLAPTDVTVANFIGQLAGSKVFRNVKMLYSRQGRTEATALGREFCIHMEVPLDCQYLPAKDQEVADAH